MGARNLAFTFGASDLAGGCVDTKLFVLPGLGLMVVGNIRPKGKDEVAKGLNIQFVFP